LRLYEPQVQEQLTKYSVPQSTAMREWTLRIWELRSQEWAIVALIRNSNLIW
jgi:hypothetical protein